jgi:hypothetical protein
LLYAGGDGYLEVAVYLVVEVGAVLELFLQEDYDVAQVLLALEAVVDVVEVVQHLVKGLLVFL